MDKPILFSAPMVQAILDGRKTMTRRVIGEDKRGEWAAVNDVRKRDPSATVPCYLDREIAVDDKSRNIMYPRFDAGDILWVRETHFRDDCDPTCAGRNDENECPFNRVGDSCYGYKTQYAGGRCDGVRWRPSIHMPREAARIFLRVTDVRVERVQDIDDGQAVKEGCSGLYLDGATFVSAKGRFHALWDGLYARRGYGWDANPWVWVISFERIEAPRP